MCSVNSWHRLGSCKNYACDLQNVNVRAGKLGPLLWGIGCNPAAAAAAADGTAAIEL
jgi:hypothetical protein